METMAWVRAADAVRTSTRPRRWRRLGLATLLAGLILAASSSAALAANPEMRGEWELVMVTSSGTLHGKALISNEADAEGKFAATNVLIEGVISGTFAGKLEGSTATVKVTTQSYGPYPAGEFNSSAMNVQTSGSNPSLSGSGTLTSNGTSSSATLTATRIRTYQETEEQRERERREREEAEQREEVRGEWALTVESGPQVVHGVARITGVANLQNEFSSNAALFEGAIPGTFSGTLSLQASKASVKVTSQAAGTYPESTFTSSAVTVTSTSTTMSMSGSGTVDAGGMSAPANFTATRTKDYAELVEQEAKEQAAAEAKAREAREAKEKQEAIEREAKEKLAKEEAAKQAGPPPSQMFNGGPAILARTFSAEPLSKALTVSTAGSLALPLSNPNAFAVTGRVTLTLASSAHRGKASRASKKHGNSRHHGKKTPPLVLGTSSFTIAADGRVTVKVTLSKAGRAQLARHKTLPALAKVVTQASGRSSASKSYTLTLHAAKPPRHHSKH